MNKNEIYIKKGLDYKKITIDLLNECNLQKLIGEKEKLIGIKPNLVSPSEASYGATTHPEIIAGIIEYLQENQFVNIVILEGSWVGDKTTEAFQVCGYDKICDTYNVPFWDMQEDKGVACECGDITLNICERVKKINFLINVPVLKGHCQTKITCALKNMKGLIPNSEKRRFHAMGLHKPIGYLNSVIHQDFIVVDNICGDLDFEDGGNPVVMNRVLAGTDPVLMDAYVCQMMQYQVEEVPYIKIAEEMGVGCGDISQMQIRVCDDQQLEQLPKSRKVVELQDAVEEVESCSACYGYLIPALEMLRQEGLLEKLNAKICIGQGFRKQTGKLGVGNCTKAFDFCVKGCPPTENQIYEALKKYINEENCNDKNVR